ncbi:MAG: diguanylate cyclase [Deltaproteobacteria bacterium]|nr:MAG: diguanylate cyclase [Deltaproteobacteria bacterium]
MTQNKKRVLIIADDSAGSDELRELLGKSAPHFVIETAASSIHTLDAIYSDPPDIMLICQSSEGEGWIDLCWRIRADTVFGYLPILLILQPSDGDLAINWGQVPVDDYLRKPITVDELNTRIFLNLTRTARTRDINPLTRLPGNYAIIREIQKRIDSVLPFAVGYVDLDHFKAYNDKYGFLRGDEVIRMTARLVTNSISRLDAADTFVGHVGGDDFVFIVSPDRLDEVCQEIISNFNLVIGDFYDEQDRVRGYIDSVNRKGETERFPILSISIAVVTNEYKPIKHIGEVSAIAAELKNRVKAMEGSCYLKDRRGSKGNAA